MIVVDTSALVSIFLQEADSDRFEDALIRQEAVIGAPTAFEFILVALRKKGRESIAEARALVTATELRVVPWELEHATIAAEALARFGGRPARLNYGDCMAYAVAKALNAPLLFKGDDFRHTDVRAALP